MTALPRLHGFALNPRVMTVRLALVEKAIAHEFVERRLGDIAGLRPDDLLAQFTTAMPAFVHGDLALYELEAILRYVDEAFPGPALQPANASARAIMVELMAIMRDHLYPCAVGEIAAAFVFGPLLGRAPLDREPDGAEARLGDVVTVIGAMSQGMVARQQSDWLLGDQPCLADMQLVPIVHLLLKTPLGAGALARSDRLMSWWARVTERAWLAAVLRSDDGG